MFYTKSGREITYYGREYAKDIISKNETIKSLDDLFQILLEAWCQETAYPSCQEEYIQEDALQRQVQIFCLW